MYVIDVNKWQLRRSWNNWSGRLRFDLAKNKRTGEWNSTLFRDVVWWTWFLARIYLVHAVPHGCGPADSLSQSRAQGDRVTCPNKRLRSVSGVRTGGGAVSTANGRYNTTSFQVVRAHTDERIGTSDVKKHRNNY